MRLVRSCNGIKSLPVYGCVLQFDGFCSEHLTVRSNECDLQHPNPSAGKTITIHHFNMYHYQVFFIGNFWVSKTTQWVYFDVTWCVCPVFSGGFWANLFICKCTSVYEETNNHHGKTCRDCCIRFCCSYQTSVRYVAASSIIRSIAKSSLSSVIYVFDAMASLIASI